MSIHLIWPQWLIRSEVETVTDVIALVAAAWPQGLNHLFAVYEDAVRRQDPLRQAEFTDRFFLACLERSEQNVAGKMLWVLAGKWHGYRKLSLSGYDYTPAEEELLGRVASRLRELLAEQLASPSLTLPSFGSVGERAIIGMWCGAFLSSYAVLNQKAADVAPLSDVDRSSPSPDSVAYYHWLLRQSLFHPFAAQHFAVDMEKLVLSPLPAYAKVLLVMWLLNIPRYNATQYDRIKVETGMAELERVTRKSPAWPDPYFHLLAEWLMTGVFRLAYLHDDHSDTVAHFGDFVSGQMKRLLPEFAAFPRRERSDWGPGRRIRVGYVSNRFVANAVTFYMANRILHHDRNSFEIHLFVIGKDQDSMTAVLAQNCDRVVRLEDQLDYPANARAIRDSQLDILIYADIGMGIPTYLLAGLRLAPLQVALLGHASTTGLPTVDYFFSSEVEPPQAAAQYREQLLRMPNVGSSQILPPGLRAGLQSGLTRGQLGIPERAFVFITCANGMKHIPERDYLWVEILRRIPQAWILVKPFSPGDYDHRLVARIARAGELAGAPERIRFVGGVDGHQGVFGLLALADAQLDTYPFNGWTTTIEALCLALPTVTQEGTGYRSRLGAGFLRAMGIEEGIAASPEQYIDWAVRLANEPTLCRWIRNRIKAARKPLLFDNPVLQVEYENALIRMVRAQTAGSIAVETGEMGI